MVRLKVREMAEAKNILNASMLRTETGLGINTAYGLWRGDVKYLHLNTIDVLCRVLQTHPGLLLEYVADDSGPRKNKR